MHLFQTTYIYIYFFYTLTYAHTYTSASLYSLSFLPNCNLVLMQRPQAGSRHLLQWSRRNRVMNEKPSEGKGRGWRSRGWTNPFRLWHGERTSAQFTIMPSTVQTAGTGKEIKLTRYSNQHQTRGVATQKVSAHILSSSTTAHINTRANVELRD